VPAGRQLPVASVPYLFYDADMPESPPKARPPAWANDPVPPPLHAVAQAIAAGETWLFAWAIHSTISYRHLSRDCGIGEERLLKIDEGAPITRSELAAFAKAWKVDADAIVLTLPPGTLLQDPPPSGPTRPDDSAPAESEAA